MPNIRHLIAIGERPETIFDMVTTRNGFAAWWNTETYVKTADKNSLRLHFGPEYFKELQTAPSVVNKRAVSKVVEAHPE